MQIQDETISTEEVMEYMMTRLMGDNEASFFRSVAGFSLARVIACFLALLELAKQKIIVLYQEQWLGDIRFAPAPAYDSQAELPFEKI
jgi:chromatin segregation and condensation protein Rec8/ScpA/Scc1 (kleisin family)